LPKAGNTRSSVYESLTNLYDSNYRHEIYELTSQQRSAMPFKCYVTNIDGSCIKCPLGLVDEKPIIWIRNPDSKVIMTNTNIEIDYTQCCFLCILSNPVELSHFTFLKKPLDISGGAIDTAAGNVPSTADISEMVKQNTSSKTYPPPSTLSASAITIYDCLNAFFAPELLSQSM
jgi:hypothetical protein